MGLFKDRRPLSMIGGIRQYMRQVIASMASSHQLRGRVAELEDALVKVCWSYGTVPGGDRLVWHQDAAVLRDAFAVLGWDEMHELTSAEWDVIKRFVWLEPTDVL